MDQEYSPTKEKKSKMGLIISLILIILIGWFLFNGQAQDKDQENGTETEENGEAMEAMELKEVYDTIDVQASDVAFDFDSRFHDGSGRFSEFSAVGSYRPEDQEAMTLKITVNAASIDTGIGQRDDHLRSEELFNVEQFPEITFELTDASLSEDEKQLTLTGDLTILETTKSISAPVTVLQNKDGSLTMKGSVTIDRREYGMKDDVTVNPISDEVPIHISLVFN